MFAKLFTLILCFNFASLSIDYTDYPPSALCTIVTPYTVQTGVLIDQNIVLTIAHTYHALRTSFYYPTSSASENSEELGIAIFGDDIGSALNYYQNHTNSLSMGEICNKINDRSTMGVKAYCIDSINLSPDYKSNSMEHNFAVVKLRDAKDILPIEIVSNEKAEHELNPYQGLLSMRGACFKSNRTFTHFEHKRNTFECGYVPYISKQLETPKSYAHEPCLRLYPSFKSMSVLGTTNHYEGFKRFKTKADSFSSFGDMSYSGILYKNDKVFGIVTRHYLPPLPVSQKGKSRKHPSYLNNMATTVSPLWLPTFQSGLANGFRLFKSLIK